MGNTYNAQTRMWEIDSTGTLWTNTLGSTPSNTIGPKWVTRIIMKPSAVSDDLIFQETTSSQDWCKMKGGPSDTSPITVDFSGENGGKGRRAVGLKVSTLDGTTTAELYVA